MRVLPWLLFAASACSLPGGDYFGRMPDHIDPHHFTWCNAGEPDFLDPALASSTISIPLITAMFDGLTTYGMDGLPVPSLATHWEISDDLRTFTFHLRHGARWTSGREVTAYDVAYTALRVLDPLTASPNADTLAPIINATDYLEHRVYRLARAAGPYHAGDVVEVVADDPPQLGARTSRRPLALRDLGAPEAAAYAHVPPGTEVELVFESGSRATWPSPGGVPWAYVFWRRDQNGVYGWVPARELDGAPHAGDRLEIRRVTLANVPDAASTAEARAADEHVPRPTVQVAASALVRTPDVLGIHVIDRYTIAFETSGPTPFFLRITTNLVLRTTPIEAVSRWPRHWTDPAHVVTSGPLHLAAWKERDRVELVRSPTYWDPAAVKLDRLTSLSIDDQAAATNIYFTGGCDAIASNWMPSSYLPALDGELRGKPYKDYSVAPYFGVYFAWINTQKLTNRHLRRALNLAIDRRQIPRFTHGGEIPTAQLTPGTPIRDLSPADLAACGVSRDTPGVALVMTSGALCYTPPPGLSYDLDAARRELALARAEGGVPDVLHYRYNAGAEAHKQIAEYLQAAWQKLGLKVELEAQEWNSMLADTKSGNYEIARFGNLGTIGDTESDFLPLFRCSSPDNRGRYCNPAFERLMDEARMLSDRHDRNAKLREAEALVLADAPVIPLYVYTQRHLIKPYVRDLAVNLIDQPPLWRIWLDPSWREHAR